MTASFLEQMVTIYIHLGMLSNTFVTLTKVRVQLGASQRMKLDSGLRRNDEGGTKSVKVKLQLRRSPE